MTFDPKYMVEAFPYLIQYLPVTLFVAVASMLLAIALGLVVALVRFAKVPVLNQLAQLHISFFRGIPTLVLLFLLYFGLPQIFPALSEIGAITTAIAGLMLKESAYLAEIFRAGLLSVDRGQLEAGLSSGFTRPQVYRRYILPQAAFNALPATGNIFIGLLKSTSIIFTLGITEMFSSAQMYAANNFRYFETFLTVGLIYWVVVIIVGFLLGRLEHSLGHPYKR